MSDEPNWLEEIADLERLIVELEAENRRLDEQLESFLRKIAEYERILDGLEGETAKVPPGVDI